MFKHRYYLAAYLTEQILEGEISSGIYAQNDRVCKIADDSLQVGSTAGDGCRSYQDIILIGIAKK